MARISSFHTKSLDRMSLHKPIEAAVATFELDGKKLLQIDTMGSTERQIPGKVSQSIQLDEASAKVLSELIKSHFGF